MRLFGIWSGEQALRASVMVVLDTVWQRGGQCRQLCRKAAVLLIVIAFPWAAAALAVNDDPNDDIEACGAIAWPLSVAAARLTCPRPDAPGQPTLAEAWQRRAYSLTHHHSLHGNLTRSRRVGFARIVCTCL
jgi:hypothetical protein